MKIEKADVMNINLDLIYGFFNDTDKESGLYLCKGENNNYISIVSNGLEKVIFKSKEKTNLIEKFCEIFNIEYDNFVWVYDEFFKTNIIISNDEIVSDNFEIFLKEI